MEKKDWGEILAGFGLWNLVEDISDDGDGKGGELQLTKDGKLLVSEIEQEIEKARKDIYSEFLEYKKSYIENIWKSGIPDDLIEDTLNNVDDYLKSKLTTK